MASWKKSRKVEIDTMSPMIEVRGYGYEQEYACEKMLVRKDRGFFVHEHLIDDKKKEGKEKVVVYIYAESTYVSNWIDWLYGQSMFSYWGQEIYNEVLEGFVEMCILAHYCEDYECVNLCLDAIRDVFVEGAADLEEPLDKLEPLLKVWDTYDEHEKFLDMIVDVVVYGPGADSGQTELWLKTLAEHYSLDTWAKY